MNQQNYKTIEHEHGQGVCAAHEKQNTRRTIPSSDKGRERHPRLITLKFMGERKKREKSMNEKRTQTFTAISHSDLLLCEVFNVALRLKDAL